MGIVYIVQARLYRDDTGKVSLSGDSFRDISSAEEYGTLISLLPPGQITYSIGPTIGRLNRVLKDYTDDDYLLLMGDPLAIGLATAVAAKWNQGNVSLLKWDRNLKKYNLIKTNVYSGIYNDRE